ncbi:MAG: hypothetical protein ACFE7E_08540 [Candidatus Hodarchaeota archaeon]
MSKPKNLVFVMVIISALWISTIPSSLTSSPPRILMPDAGDSWVPFVNISQSSYNAYTARVSSGLAVDPQGNIHIVYHGYFFDTFTNSEEIFYATNIGGSWSAPYNITQNNLRDYHSTIAVDRQGNIHVVYPGNDSQDFDIFYVNKTASGWSSPVNVSRNTNEDYAVSIAIDPQGYIHIVWYGTDGSSANDGEIFYANNTGGSWSTPLNLTQNDLYDSTASIAVDASGKCHVTWEGEDGSSSNDVEVFYTNNVGGSWVISNVTQNDEDDSLSSIGLDSAGNVHLAYELYNNTSFDSGAFYVNNSGSWGTPVNISSTNGYVSRLSLVVDGSDDIHVAFSQFDGIDTEIYYVNNTVGSWGVPVNITQNDTDDARPNMVLGRQGYAHIIFYNSSVGDHNVFYIRSTEPVGPPIQAGFPIVLLIGVGVAVVVVIAAAAAWLLRKRR